MAEPGECWDPDAAPRKAAGTVCGERAHVPTGTGGVAGGTVAQAANSACSCRGGRCCCPFLGKGTPEPACRASDGPLLWQPDASVSLTCPAATKELAAKLASSFHTHRAISPEGGSATKRGVGMELGSPVSSALVPSPRSAGPGWGPSAPRSLLPQSWLLDHCINPTQKSRAPCPNHGPARLSRSYHNPPFALHPHPLTWEGMGSLSLGSRLPKRCYPLWPGQGNSGLQRKAACPRTGATRGGPSSLPSPGSYIIPAPLLLKK